MKDSARAVLDLMVEMDGACGQDFQDRRLGRFGARINELRNADFVVTRELCRRHPHRNRVWLYRVFAFPADFAQTAPAVAR